MAYRIFMIAGPNGAGKTTTALALQPDLLRIYEYVNVDEIAHGLAPLHPESMVVTASKLMMGLRS
jgi:predicted ABC-type ATPase